MDDRENYITGKGRERKGRSVTQHEGDNEREKLGDDNDEESQMLHDKEVQGVAK